MSGSRSPALRPNGQSCSNDRSPQWSVRLERRHSGCRARPGPGQSHADAGNRRGADDSPVVRPAGCVQGRIRRDVGPAFDDPQTAKLPADVMTVGKTSVAWGKQQAGVDVSRSRASRLPSATATLDDEIHGRERRGETRREHVRVHVQRLQRLEQSAQSGGSAVRRQDDGKEERHRRPRHYDDADGNGTDVCRGACSGKRQGGDQADESASQLDDHAQQPTAGAQMAAVATPRRPMGSRT